MFGSIFNQKKDKDDQNPQSADQNAAQNGTQVQNDAAPSAASSPSTSADVSQNTNAQYAGPQNSGSQGVGGQNADTTAGGPQSASGTNMNNANNPTDASQPGTTPGGAQNPDSTNPNAQAAGADGATTGDAAKDGETPKDGEQAGAAKSDEKAGISQNNPALRTDMSSLSHLDPRATQVLTHAQEETKRIHQQNIEPDQLLFGLLYDEQIYKIFTEFQVDGGKISKEIQAKEKMGTYRGQPTLSKTSQTVFDQAYRDAKMRGSNFVSPEDIFVVLCSPNYTTATYLEKEGIKKEKVVEKLAKNPNSNYGHKTVLEKYGLDLTEEARAGKLDPVAGRDKEVDRIVHVLLRRTKNNPIIIGEPGVGKTAIVEGLAQQIVAGKVPKDLQDKRIFQLDLASLVAGASHRGEFEERLRDVINEVLGANNKIILFIDEIHSLMGTGEGEGMNAANIIKPHLARGHFQIIGATTTMEYRKNFEKDKAFERRFQPVQCEEPSEENALEMLKIIRPKYEKYHRVTLSDETLKQCVKLSKKYIGERYLPDKAIDLLDEASSHVKLEGDSGKRGDNQVKKTDIETVVAAWTGIPITKLTEDESEKLLKLEDRIHHRMVDQQEAVVAVSEAVRRGRIGLASGQRPIASFIFLGPTGVGKTELAKTLAELLFGRDDAMARLDMSEYMEKHEVAKIIGAPPGYVGYEEGGVLTEAVRKKPYCIVLLDEIEKAHPDVFNILLQLLEDGRLTDNKGNTISFKNTIVICTSNIGSQLIQKHLGTTDASVTLTPEQEAKQFKELDKLVRDEIIKFLRPEVLNRFDEIIIFKPLRLEHMAGIVRLGIAKTAALLKEQGYGLQITEKAVAKLSKDGYDPVYGARPLRRLIQTAIENPIALAIISKKFVVGDTIVIDYNDNLNEFTFLKGGQTVDAKTLSAEQIKLILQKFAHPENIADDSEKSDYTAMHDKIVTASTANNSIAAEMLQVSAATVDDQIRKIRDELMMGRDKGDAFCKDIMEFIDRLAQQVGAASNVKKVLLQIVNPATVQSQEKRNQFTEIHDKLVAAGDQNELAKSILGVNDMTTPDAIDKIMKMLKDGKDNEDELATLVATLVNTTIAEQAEEATKNDPNVKFKKYLKELINPLYAAAPENKDTFSKLYDKIGEAAKQNHTIAQSILALTDITSDMDITAIHDKLVEAKEQKDPLSTEILDTIDNAIKYEGVVSLKETLLLLINPISAKTPSEREQYTEVQAKINEANQKGDALAAKLVAVNEATNKDELLALKAELEKLRDNKDEVATWILSVANGEYDPAQGDANASQPDPNYPFGKPEDQAQAQDGTQPADAQSAEAQTADGQTPTDGQPVDQSAAPAADGQQPLAPAPAGMAMNTPMQGQPMQQMPMNAQPMQGMPMQGQQPMMQQPMQQMPIQGQPVQGQPMMPMQPQQQGFYQQPPVQGNTMMGNAGGAMAGAAEQATTTNSTYPPVMNENLSTANGVTVSGNNSNNQS